MMRVVLLTPRALCKLLLMPLHKLRIQQKGLNLYARMMEHSNTEESTVMMEALYYMRKQLHS